MAFEIKADELEQNFFSNIKPSFGLLRKMNFQIPPLSEFTFWDNIKNSDYAKKYIEECFDYLLLNCSIIKAANPPSASQDSSITHETASAMKSVLLSLIHITTFYKRKRSNSKEKENENNQQNIHQINPLENKASIIIKNSSFPQIVKVIEFTINQLFNEPVHIVKDIPTMLNYLKSINEYPCKELKSTSFFNTLLLFHRLSNDKLTKELFYPSLLEIMKSKLKISSNSTKLLESIRYLFRILYLYYLVMSIHPELSHKLRPFLPYLNSRIINSNPFSSLCCELHASTKKEIEYPGYCFYKMLEYGSNISPMTNNTVTIFFDFQNKLFPNMLYGRENDKLSFKLAYINYVNYYLKKNLGVDEEQVSKLSISDKLKILQMIKFTKKDDAKILKEFKLKSTKAEEFNLKNKKDENEEEEKNDIKNDQDENENENDIQNDQNVDENEKVPIPPYIPFHLVRIQPNLYLNPDNLIMMQTCQNISVNQKIEIEIDKHKELKEKEKRKRSQTKKKGKEENFEESYDVKRKLSDESERYMYNCVLHKVYLDSVFKPIFEYMKANEDQRDEVLNHKILVCGNDSAMGKLLMFHLISSLQTDPAAKAAGLIKNLNIEILENVNLMYYIFPFKNASCNTQLANFLASIDPVYDKFVKDVYDLTSHIAPTFNEASNVSFIPVEENTGNEIQKKIDAPKPQQPSEQETNNEKAEEESEEKISQNENNKEEEKRNVQNQEQAEDSLKHIIENEPDEEKQHETENNNVENNINNDGQNLNAPQQDSITNLNKFDSDNLITCNPTPSSMLQLAIQHYLLFAREHVDILVWSCVIYMNNKKVVIPFVSGLRFGFSSTPSASTGTGVSANSSNNNANNQPEEIKPKKLIIETIDSNNRLSELQKIKLVSFSIWNSNMDLNCDPRSPLLLKEVCYTVSAHTQLLQRENLRANGSFSFSSNRLSLIDSLEKKGKKKLTINTNVVPTTGQIPQQIISSNSINNSPSSEKVQQQTVFNASATEQNIGLSEAQEKQIQNVDSDGNCAESNSCIIDLNDENKNYHRVTKKMRDNWASLSFPKNEQIGIEQNLKAYTHEFIKGITVSVDKDQPPFNILVDGVEYEQVKKFQIEPMINPADGVEQMKLRLACFISS